MSPEILESLSVMPFAISVSDLSTWLQERQVMSGLIQQHLQRARTRMKKQADQKRCERVAVVPGTKIQSKTGIQIFWAI
jgi:uncharacterized protein YwlG (UPF0340 family)